MKLLASLYGKAKTSFFFKSVLLSNSAIKPPFQVYLSCKGYERFVNRIYVTFCANARKSNISNILHISNINKVFKLWIHLNKKGAVLLDVRLCAAPILYPEDGGSRFPERW